MVTASIGKYGSDFFVKADFLFSLTRSCLEIVTLVIRLHHVRINIYSEVFILIFKAMIHYYYMNNLMFMLCENLTFCC